MYCFVGLHRVERYLDTQNLKYSKYRPTEISSWSARVQYLQCNPCSHYGENLTLLSVFNLFYIDHEYHNPNMTKARFIATRWMFIYERSKFQMKILQSPKFLPASQQQHVHVWLLGNQNTWCNWSAVSYFIVEDTRTNLIELNNQ